MQNRILFPLLFQAFHCQSFEQLFLPLKICLKRAHKKAFAEPAWTAQEIVTARLDKFVYLGGFVYITVSVPADLLEILYPYRVKFSAHNVATIIRRSNIR